MRNQRLIAAREERGQVLVMAVMFMAVLLGAAALTLDIGRMAVTRRYLQNAADSSALAGAWSLRTSTSAAVDDATEWATDEARYALSGSELESVEILSTSTPNDSVKVDVQRQVPWIFARVFPGFDSQRVSATATAQLRRINGVTAGRTRGFPFAIWGGNPGQTVGPGDRDVVFHSNQYDRDSNIDPRVDCETKPRPAGCTWDVSENFKGYFHWQDGYNYYTKPTDQAFSQGGNAYGTSDYEEMYQYYKQGIPVLLPVITTGNDNQGSGINFTIVDFVCVRITWMDNANGNRPWTGDVVQCAADGLYDGPNTPGSGSSWVPILIR